MGEDSEWNKMTFSESKPDKKMPRKDQVHRKEKVTIFMGLFTFSQVFNFQISFE